MENFYDQKDGFFHLASQAAEKLIAKKKEVFDNVIPASNSVMAHNLHTLGVLLDKEEWKDLAIKMTTRLAALIESEPGYMSNWGILFSEIIHGISEVVISGDDALAHRQELHRHFSPFIISVGTRDKSELPLLAGRDAKANETFIYVCKNKTCQLPVNTPAEALTQLQ
jgi:uncharacterized protein YyaL (SSP411 family)